MQQHWSATWGRSSPECDTWPPPAAVWSVPAPAPAASAAPSARPSPRPKAPWTSCACRGTRPAGSRPSWTGPGSARSSALYSAGVQRTNTWSHYWWWGRRFPTLRNLTLTMSSSSFVAACCFSNLVLSWEQIWNIGRRTVHERQDVAFKQEDRRWADWFRAANDTLFNRK